MKKTSLSFIFAALTIAFGSIMTPAASAAELTGSWQKHAVSTSGTWTITADSVTLHDLKTGRAPDLKLILSPHAVDALESENAMEGAIVITPIKDSKGTFTFALPEGVDLSQFQSIGIHCERYTKLFAKASLS
ncbi:MAG: DM13 domain-containing protein [Verrucomicrobiota bacterium]